MSYVTETSNNYFEGNYIWYGFVSFPYPHNAEYDYYISGSIDSTGIMTLSTAYPDSITNANIKINYMDYTYTNATFSGSGGVIKSTQPISSDISCENGSLIIKILYEHNVLEEFTAVPGELSMSEIISGSYIETAVKKLITIIKEKYNYREYK